jgi:hypothetical protein
MIATFEAELLSHERVANRRDFTLELLLCAPEDQQTFEIFAERAKQTRSQVLLIRNPNRARRSHDVCSSCPPNA